MVKCRALSSRRPNKFLSWAWDLFIYLAKGFITMIKRYPWVLRNQFEKNWPNSFTLKMHKMGLVTDPAVSWVFERHWGTVQWKILPILCCEINPPKFWIFLEFKARNFQSSLLFWSHYLHFAFCSILVLNCNYKLIEWRSFQKIFHFHS